MNRNFLYDMAIGFFAAMFLLGMTCIFLAFVGVSTELAQCENGNSQP